MCLLYFKKSLPKPKSQSLSFLFPCFIVLVLIKNMVRKFKFIFLYFIFLFFSFCMWKSKFSITLLWKLYPLFIKLSCALDWVMCPQNSYVELYLPLWWHLEMGALGRFTMFKWGLKARLLMIGLVLLLDETTEVLIPCLFLCYMNTYTNTM